MVAPQRHSTLQTKPLEASQRPSTFQPRPSEASPRLSTFQPRPSEVSPRFSTFQPRPTEILPEIDPSKLLDVKLLKSSALLRPRGDGSKGHTNERHCCARRGCTCHAPKPHVVSPLSLATDQLHDLQESTSTFSTSKQSWSRVYNVSAKMAWTALQEQLIGSMTPSVGSKIVVGQPQRKLGERALRGLLLKEALASQELSNHGSDKDFNAIIASSTAHRRMSGESHSSQRLGSDHGSSGGASHHSGTPLPPLSARASVVTKRSVAIEADDLGKTKSSTSSTASRRASALPSEGDTPRKLTTLNFKQMSLERGRRSTNESPGDSPKSRWSQGQSEESPPKKPPKRLQRLKACLQQGMEEYVWQRRLHAIPLNERTALEKAFKRFDADESGTLEAKELHLCLRDLALAGSNTQEKREVWKICRECANLNILRTNKAAKELLMTPAAKKRSKPVRRKSRKEAFRHVTFGCAKFLQEHIEEQATLDGKRISVASLKKSSPAEMNDHEEKQGHRSVSPDGSEASSSSTVSEVFDIDTTAATADDENDPTLAIDFLAFALFVVPRVRDRLKELQGDHIMRYFCHFDRDGTGKLNLPQCLEIGRILGVDIRSLEKEILKHDGAEVEVDFDTFQKCIFHAREQAFRHVKQREVEIQEATGISDEAFEEFRGIIVQLYEVFNNLAEDFGTGKVLNFNNSMSALRELGLMPRTGNQRADIEALFLQVHASFAEASEGPPDADQNENSQEEDDSQEELTFIEFLEFLRRVREFWQEQRRDELLRCFQKYDRDFSGLLSLSEIIPLLDEIGCIAHSRQDQDEVVRLIQSVDIDGNGSIDFDEFQELIQRIDEKFSAIRYEAEVQHALACGFTESQLSDFRAIFELIDTNGTGKLALAELRHCLQLMKKHVSQEALETAFFSLDQDRSGFLEFIEFIDFMKLMRDCEGIFADEQYRIAIQVQWLEDRALRGVLHYLNLSKAYIESLRREEAVALFCEIFEVSPSENFQEKLRIRSYAELIHLARIKCETGSVKAK